MTEEATVGEKLAVMEHRIEQLEQWPPRIEAVEKQVDAVKSALAANQESMEDMKEESHATNVAVSELRDLVMRLFWTGTGIAIAAASILSIGIPVWKLLPQ